LRTLIDWIRKRLPACGCSSGAVYAATLGANTERRGDGRTARRRARALSTGAIFAIAALACSTVAAATDDAEPDRKDESNAGLGADIKAYVTAPLHARRAQWVRFGAVVGAIGVAYHYDDEVRAHFQSDSAVSSEPPDTHDAGDALPAALVLGGTFLGAVFADSDDGRRETGMMVESAALSSVAAYVLKQAAGRERPFVTGDPGNWQTGDDSFPSLHATAAFAIGTVLAESGNDRYRWLRRALGYGMAAATAYARMDHDAHWFSDVVAGAGLGIGTARFVMKRRDAGSVAGHFELKPSASGVQLSYTVALRP